MKHARSRLAVSAFAALLSLATPVAAHALVVGPGDPIRTPMEGSPWDGHRNVNSPMCSTGVPGVVTDRNGEKHRVMLTAGHCLNDAPDVGLPIVTGEVYVPTTEGDKRIGTAGAHRWEVPQEDDDLASLPAAFNGADYGVINLDPEVETTGASYSIDENGRSHGEPVVMTGIQDNKDLPRGEVSFDNFGKPICKDGMRTGRACGYQVFRARNGIWTVGIGVDHGDSGGNAYDPTTNEVIGVNSMAFGPVSRVMPADIAIEEAYGIPDGQVNDHFEVSDSANQRDSSYRTLNEDMAADREYVQQQNSQPSQGDSVPQLDGLADRLPQLPQLPELPQSPHLPQSPQLPQMPAFPQVVDGIDLPALPELPQLAGIELPSLGE